MLPHCSRCSRCPESLFRLIFAGLSFLARREDVVHVYGWLHFLLAEFIALACWQKGPLSLRQGHICCILMHRAMRSVGASRSRQQLCY